MELENMIPCRKKTAKNAVLSSKLSSLTKSTTPTFEKNNVTGMPNVLNFVKILNHANQELNMFFINY